MCKEVSLAVSHRIFKWKEVSNGKFGKKKIFFCNVLYLRGSKALNSLIRSSNFLILSLGFSMYRIMSSANSESFLLPFQSEFFLFLFLL